MQETPDARNPKTEPISGMAQELLGLGDPIWGLSAFEILRLSQLSPRLVSVGVWITPPVPGLSEHQETSDST